MGLPPVVVGLVVALALWRSGPLGFLGLMYTKTAMGIAQVLIALPLVVGISLAALMALGDDWHVQVRALGVRGWRATWLLLRETRAGLLAAVIAGLGGILSEVGAVMMVGGNLEGETRVLTTGILMYTQMGRFAEALALSAMLLGLTFVLAGALTALQQAEPGVSGGPRCSRRASCASCAASRRRGLHARDRRARSARGRGARRGRSERRGQDDAPARARRARAGLRGPRATRARSVRWR